MYAEFSLSFSKLDGVSSDGGLVLSRSACASACLGPVSIHAKSYERNLVLQTVMISLRTWIKVLVDIDLHYMNRQGPRVQLKTLYVLVTHLLNGLRVSNIE